MTASSRGDVTCFLDRWREGDEEALPKLVTVVHEELRSIASAFLRRERHQHGGLETSVLVNEAYLRLVDLKRITARNRAQFFSLAARILRNVLVDHARSHLAAKRGAGAQPASLDEALSISMDRPAEIVALDDALKCLAATYPQQARILELRHFAGLTHEEIGQEMGISVTTVARGCRMARAWLYRHLADGGEP